MKDSIILYEVPLNQKRIVELDLRTPLMFQSEDQIYACLLQRIIISQLQLSDEFQPLPCEELHKEREYTPSAEVQLRVVGWDLNVRNVEFLTAGGVDHFADGQPQVLVFSSIVRAGLVRYCLRDGINRVLREL